MPEIQNIFVKSRMNQDIDDRLLPNGEYRRALNVAISRSEGSDVGTVQNVLGNSLIDATEISGIKNLSVIGYYVDQSKNDIFMFLTDYVDCSSSGLANFAPSTANCFIYKYNSISNLYTKLVEGYYLNFSKNSPVQGVNVLEGLLFFTDNRNQPRKINISKAVGDSNYYNTEDKISVAKYYPYTPINLVNIAGDNLGESTMTNPSQQYLDIEEGGEEYENPDYDEDWAGDPELLSDKFVRFSYRFKFDDGEYSLQAPWTQICFIPKQQGYFNTNDSTAAYRSTIVSFMENNVTQMLLNISFPTENPIEDLNIESLDILYKESDGLAIKVIETIPATSVYAQMQSNSNNLVYSYKYISTKPYKTLPSSESTRVYDTVPIRCLTQEVVSNRIVYANFVDKQTPPDSLNYGVSYGVKDSVVFPVEKIYSQIEYPSSSLKQNRNYQAAFVLADRFGRQSSVILSSKDFGSTEDGLLYGGSTVYVPYTDGNTDALNFPGYELKVLVDTIENGSFAIPVERNLNTGYPGVYKDNLKGVDSAIINQAGTGYSDGENISTTGGSGTGCTVDIETTLGEITKVTINKQGTGYTNGDILIPSTAAGSDGSFKVTVYDPNPLGWYSYKIVIKQTEQEYYNVYLPGILNGYPYGSSLNLSGASEELGKTANIVLFSDNVNKVPKDLSEVGPDQRQYRSSVNLFGRVEPYSQGCGYTSSSVYSTQYFPTALSDSVPSISNLRDINYVPLKNNPGSPDDLSYVEFYQSDTNPSIARISTNRPIGKCGNSETDYGIALGVYETAPVTSLLDIYWETSTVGLIYELNKTVQSDFTGPSGLNLDNQYVHFESDGPGTQLISGRAIDTEGGSFSAGEIVYSLSAVNDDNGDAISQFNQNGDTRSGKFCFDLVSGQNGFTISISPDTYFYYNSDIAKNEFTFIIECYNTTTNDTTVVKFPGWLSNNEPEITSPASEASFTFVMGKGNSNIVQMAGVNGVNTSADDSTKRKELTWSMGEVIENGTETDEASNFGFLINTNLGLVTVDENFLTVGSTYSIPITLTDSGGLQDTHTLTVVTSASKLLNFKLYARNSSQTSNIPYIENVYFQWQTAEDLLQNAYLVDNNDQKEVKVFYSNTILREVDPFPNDEFRVSWSFFNNQPQTDPTPTKTRVYVYRGDPGPNQSSSATLIGGSGDIPIPPSSSLETGSIPITPNKQLDDSIVYTIYILFDDDF